MKTGGGGGPWVELERPKPARVPDRYLFWGEPPPELSERCRFWLRQIQRGWRPNRFLRSEGYDGQAEWYGVYLWEFLHRIAPALSARTDVQ